MTITMKDIANRYADELDAQFGTLSFLTKHTGEIGRTHEAFLRSVLQRFLPGKLECGTGFVARPEGVSDQQDIIVYEPNARPLLFKADDCVVVDSDATAGVIEVKTALESAAAMTEAIDHAMRATKFTRGFSALYACRGLTLESLLDVLWDRYGRTTELSQEVAPDAIYVRGRYLLVRYRRSGRRDTPPFRVLQIGKQRDDDEPGDAGKHSEGDALISLVAFLWLTGIQNHAARPWWIEERDENEDQFFKEVKWPKDLQQRADREQRACEGR